MSDNGWFELCFVVVVVVVVAEVGDVRFTCDRNNGQRRILGHVRRRMLWPERALIRWNEMNCPGCRGTSRSSSRSRAKAAPPKNPACTRTTTDDTFLAYMVQICSRRTLSLLYYPSQSDK
uniref:Uncharacterized protein n=1 Tax=Schizaphis graminum TaxID=13262 RepID=A0A2S2NP88_SCHGA